MWDQKYTRNRNCKYFDITFHSNGNGNMHYGPLDKIKLKAKLEYEQIFNKTSSFNVHLTKLL